MTAFVLVADTGGTNTRVSIAIHGRLDRDRAQKYRNADFPGLGDLLREYLQTQGLDTPAAVCVAIAGPVADGAGRLTNLDWHITKETLCAATGAHHAAVLNDLQAQGFGIDRIAENDLHHIARVGAQAPGSTRLVIGVGTGFNAAAVFQTPVGLMVPPSEAGHIDLPQRSADDLSLAAYIAERHGMASVEEVLSGRGLENTYRWICDKSGAPDTRSAAEIMGAMLIGDDALARATVAQAVHSLGHVMGNLALTYLPFGGIYLIGGVARALSPYFAEYGLMSAFVDKGRFTDFMRRFPVALVEDDNAALEGCATYLAQLEGQEPKA